MRIAAILVLMIAPAWAGSSDIRLPPPAKYDRPATVPVEVYRDISPCPATAEVVACSGLIDGVGYIMISPHLSGDLYNMALRHETAHINGWPGDHPR